MLLCSVSLSSCHVNTGALVYKSLSFVFKRVGSVVCVWTGALFWSQHTALSLISAAFQQLGVLMSWDSSLTNSGSRIGCFPKQVRNGYERKFVLHLQLYINDKNAFVHIFLSKCEQLFVSMRRQAFSCALLYFRCTSIYGTLNCKIIYFLSNLTIF